MKRKILVLLLVIFGLLIGACGKSEDKNSSILDTLKNEKNIASKNLDKYNSYINFNNFLIDTTAIDIFDAEYLDKIYKEDGSFKNLDKKSLQDFGERAKREFKILEEHLNEVKKHVNDKPKYEFDPEVEKFVNTTLKLKEKIYSIINYYRNGDFEKDNYKGAEKLDEEYLELLNSFFEYSGEFFNNIEKLAYENNRIYMKELEKNGEIVLLTMMKFGNTANRFSDVLYDRQDFIFSDEESKELKELNQKLIKEFSDLENVKDEQLEDEALDKKKYRNHYTKKAKELIKFTTAIIEGIEKKRNIDNDLDGFDRAYSGLVDAYNSIIL